MRLVPVLRVVGPVALLLSLSLARTEEAAPAPTLDNLYLELSREVLEAGAAQDIDRTKPVQETILGTDVRGVGRTLAGVRMELIPEETRAVFDLVIEGKTYAKTVGRTGPVALYSDSVVPFQVRRRVVLDRAGYRSWSAEAAADSQSELTCLTTRFSGCLDRVVRRIALRSYRRQKDEAAAEASRLAERDYLEESREDVEAQLARRQKEFDSNLDDLTKRGIVLDSLRFSTTTDRLRLHAGVGAAKDRASLAAPPTVPASASMVLRVHQTATNHASASSLKGKTYTGEELDRQLARLPGFKPSKQPKDPTPWSVKFAPRDPLAVKFDNHRIEAKMKFTEFTSDEDAYTGMDVTARYLLKEGPKGYVAVRQGRLDVFPPGFDPDSGKKLSARQQAMRTVLEKRLNRVLTEEITLEDLVLSGDLKKAGPLKVTAADTINGWLVVAWRQTKK